MATKQLPQKNQKCISECVRKYYRSGVYGDDNWRDRSYDHCVMECRLSSKQ
jgi:hypothetical protein